MINFSIFRVIHRGLRTLLWLVGWHRLLLRWRSSISSRLRIWWALLGVLARRTVRHALLRTVEARIHVWWWAPGLLIWWGNLASCLHRAGRLENKRNVGINLMLYLHAKHVKPFHSFKFYLLEAEYVCSGLNQPWMQDKLDFGAEFADTCG